MIKEDSVRYQIQTYYQLTDHLKEVLNVNNKNINDAILAQTSFIDVNSIMESTFPIEQRAEADPLEFSFFDRPLEDPEVQSCIKQITIRRVSTRFNQQIYRNRLQRAQQLKANLNSYLKAN